MSCHWSCDPRWVKISGHSEQLGPCGSASHFVDNRHSRVKTRGVPCIGGFGQTHDRRKFELGIPQSLGAPYITLLEVHLILETRQYSFMRHVSWTLDSGNGLVPSVTKPWPAPIKWLLRSTRLWYLMHWKCHSFASNYQYYNACCTPCSKGQTREIHEFQGPSLLFDTLNPEQINGLVQDCSISSAFAMEIL